MAYCLTRNGITKNLGEAHGMVLRNLNFLSFTANNDILSNNSVEGAIAGKSIDRLDSKMQYIRLPPPVKAAQRRPPRRLTRVQDPEAAQYGACECRRRGRHERHPTHPWLGVHRRRWPKPSSLV